MGVTIVLILALFLVLYTSSKKHEGFANKSVQKEEKEEPNVLLSLMGNLKRMSGYIVNPTTWSDRFEIMNMTPTELARRYIKSQSNVE